MICKIFHDQQQNFLTFLDQINSLTFPDLPGQWEPVFTNENS